ncbi:hypothetical protein [uncultured Jatrophihabitans sp.]|uniref:hypothetical protein n=1 Tax=uncultured Jatrophihabitans sp. TaxID=1610747 RepID=UPI0035CC2CDC
MSITSDIRSYADNAVSQGKHVLDQAQSSLNDVTGRARDNVTDLRASAEKVVNLDAVTTAIEPYVAQLRQYSTAVTDRVEHAVDGLRSDKRIGGLIDSAESLSNTVVETFNQRVVKPVQSLTGRSTSRPTTTRKAAPKPRPAKSANTRPAAKSGTRKPATTRSASAKTPAKTAAKTARKTAAKRPSSS